MCGVVLDTLHRRTNEHSRGAAGVAVSLFHTRRQSYCPVMERDQIIAATAEERRSIADLIDDLDAAQLAAPSLCGGWNVKTVGAHLLSFLADGTLKMTLLGVRRGNPDRAIDELARRKAQLSSAEIASGLRMLADRQYWRPPPQAPGLLAEVLAHSGDMRIALRASLRARSSAHRSCTRFSHRPGSDRGCAVASSSRSSPASN